MAAMIGNWGHTGWLGLRYHGHGADWMELALPWRDELVGDAQSGVLASGPIVSMMDMVTSMAINQKLGRNAQLVTIDLRVDYTRAAQPHRTVIGRGECYKLTRSIGFVRGVAYDESLDDPLAHVAGSFMIVDGVAA
ncbi:MAG: PaaI family thioesterase [Sphingomonadales bacterium]|nr:PaaI family thioesterase [Sphingomonadales bacterium]